MFRDLLSQLLEVDPTVRPTASSALLHPWLKTEEELSKIEFNIFNENNRSLGRARTSSMLLVEGPFREALSKPAPPRMVPAQHEDAERSKGHHGLGIFRYMFKSLHMDDRKSISKLNVDNKSNTKVNFAK
jgi:serine/threonine protein kinase